MPTYELHLLKSQRNKYLYLATADKPGKVCNKLSVNDRRNLWRKEERERELRLIGFC